MMGARPLTALLAAGVLPAVQGLRTPPVESDCWPAKAEPRLCIGATWWHTENRAAGAANPLQCLKDKTRDWVYKMLLSCDDIPNVPPELNPDDLHAPDSNFEFYDAAVRDGTWRLYSRNSTRCPQRWSYLIALKEGLGGCSAATPQLTLDMLRATVAWADPLAKGGMTTLAAAFARMDRGADGALSPEEFSPSFSAAGEEVVRGLFRLIDRSGDGTIQFRELLAYLRAVTVAGDIAPEALWPTDVVLDQNMTHDHFDGINDDILHWVNFYQWDT